MNKSQYKREDHMAVGFVLIRIKSGVELETYKKLSDVNEITELYQIFGEYDFLVKIKAENIELIGRVLINKIRIIDGVTNTITLTETIIPSKR